MRFGHWHDYLTIKNISKTNGEDESKTRIYSAKKYEEQCWNILAGKPFFVGKVGLALGKPVGESWLGRFADIKLLLFEFFPLSLSAYYFELMYGEEKRKKRLELWRGCSTIS
jgi:hypothetical protein